MFARQHRPKRSSRSNQRFLDLAAVDHDVFRHRFGVAADHERRREGPGLRRPCSLARADGLPDRLKRLAPHRLSIPVARFSAGRRASSSILSESAASSQAYLAIAVAIASMMTTGSVRGEMLWPCRPGDATRQRLAPGRSARLVGRTGGVQLMTTPWPGRRRRILGSNDPLHAAIAQIGSAEIAHAPINSATALYPERGRRRASSACPKIPSRAAPNVRASAGENSGSHSSPRFLITTRSPATT